MIQNKKKMLDSGFTREQTYYALKKAQTGYHLSNKENNLQGKKYYAWIIYKLERELGASTIPLGEVKMLALQFYANNAQLFENGVKGEAILKTMMERGYMPDKPIKMKKS